MFFPFLSLGIDQISMFEADALHLFVRHKHAATFVILPLHFLPLLLFLPLFGLAVDLPLQLRTLHLPQIQHKFPQSRPKLIGTVGVHSGIKGGLRGKEDAFSDLHADRYLQLRPHAFQFRCQAEALHEMLREDRDGRDEVQFFSEGEEESDVQWSSPDALFTVRSKKGAAVVGFFFYDQQIVFTTDGAPHIFISDYLCQFFRRKVVIPLCVSCPFHAVISDSVSAGGIVVGFI